MGKLTPASGNERRLLLDSIIFDLQAGGGISRYWYELVSKLIRRRDDWRTTILANPRTQNSLLTGILQQMGEHPGVELRTFRGFFLERFRSPRLGHAGRALWHSSYYRVPGDNVPSVCTVHDFTHERYGTHARAWLQHCLKARAIRHSAQIICVSESTRKDLLAFFPEIAAETCHVIHHGLSQVFFPSDDQQSSEQQYVLFVGQRASFKNFQLAVAAAAAANVSLFIVGGGALSAAERTLLETHLPSRYKGFNHATDEVLRGLYQSAIALTYLSLYEGFGLPVLEAMACGCPVIAMNTSSIPEVAADCAVLLDKEDAHTVADAIRAVQEVQRRGSLIEKGLRRARKFSWDRAVDQTVDVYELAWKTAGRERRP